MDTVTYSGIDRYSGTKNPGDAILFTVSGITAIVELKFRFFEAQSYKRPLLFSKNKISASWGQKDKFEVSEGVSNVHFHREKNFFLIELGWSNNLQIFIC